MELLSAENLKNQLWATMLSVRDGRIAAREANAIAAQSREIIRVVRTEIMMADRLGEKPSAKLLGCKRKAK